MPALSPVMRVIACHTINYRLTEDRLELSTARGEVPIHAPLGSSPSGP